MRELSSTSTRAKRTALAKWVATVWVAVGVMAVVAICLWLAGRGWRLEEDVTRGSALVEVATQAVVLELPEPAPVNLSAPESEPRPVEVSPTALEMPQRYSEGGGVPATEHAAVKLMIQVLDEAIVRTQQDARVLELEPDYEKYALFRSEAIELISELWTEVQGAIKKNTWSGRGLPKSMTLKQWSEYIVWLEALTEDEWARNLNSSCIGYALQAATTLTSVSPAELDYGEEVVYLLTKHLLREKFGVAMARPNFPDDHDEDSLTLHGSLWRALSKPGESLGGR